MQWIYYLIKKNRGGLAIVACIISSPKGSLPRNAKAKKGREEKSKEATCSRRQLVYLLLMMQYAPVLRHSSTFHFPSSDGWADSNKTPSSVDCSLAAEKNRIQLIEVRTWHFVWTKWFEKIVFFLENIIKADIWWQVVQKLKWRWIR